MKTETWSDDCRLIRDSLRPEILRSGRGLRTTRIPSFDHPSFDLPSFDLPDPPRQGRLRRFHCRRRPPASLSLCPLRLLCLCRRLSSGQLCRLRPRSARSKMAPAEPEDRKDTKNA